MTEPSSEIPRPPSNRRGVRNLINVFGFICLVAAPFQLANDNIEAIAFAFVGICWLVAARLLLPRD
jgi:1,6-anhydro-N-acetylmuramate kinase